MSDFRGRSGERGLPAATRLSVLDRLIDEEPDKLRDAPLSHGEALDALRRSVRRAPFMHVW